MKDIKLRILSYIALFCLVSSAGAKTHFTIHQTLVEEPVYLNNTVDKLIIPAYLSTPQKMKEGVKYPAVVLAHACDGVFSNFDPSSTLMPIYKRWMKSLTAQNYIVILVDSFSSRQYGQNQCIISKNLTSEVYERPNDINAAFDFLVNDMEKYVSSSHVGLLGWSIGGSTVLASLSDTYPKRYSVGVSYYPECNLSDAFNGISQSNWVPYCDLYILHAGSDHMYHSGACQDRIKNAEELIEESGSDVIIEMVVYPGTKHGFDLAMKSDSMFGDKDVNARISSDKKVLEIFEKYLKSENHLPDTTDEAESGSSRIQVIIFKNVMLLVLLIFILFK